MKDRNGVEIQVGDTVVFIGTDEGADTGTVSEVGRDYYVCNDWSSGVENGIKFYLEVCVEVISKSKQKETIMTPAQDVTTNTTKHKYADILIAIANGEQIECRIKSSDKQWTVFKDNDTTLYHLSQSPMMEFRIKPKTININGHEVPEPVKKPLELGQKYWIVNFNFNKFVSDHYWIQDSSDAIWLERGIMHLTAEAAQKHTEALLSFTKV